MRFIRNVLAASSGRRPRNPGPRSNRRPPPERSQSQVDRGTDQFVLDNVEKAADSREGGWSGPLEQNANVAALSLM